MVRVMGTLLASDHVVYIVGSKHYEGPPDRRPGLRAHCSSSCVCTGFMMGDKQIKNNKRRDLEGVDDFPSLCRKWKRKYTNTSLAPNKFRVDSLKKRFARHMLGKIARIKLQLRYHRWAMMWKSSLSKFLLPMHALLHEFCNSTIMAIKWTLIANLLIARRWATLTHRNNKGSISEYNSDDKRLKRVFTWVCEYFTKENKRTLIHLHWGPQFGKCRLTHVI